jgi:hypothetical protein
MISIKISFDEAFVWEVLRAKELSESADDDTGAIEAVQDAFSLGDSRLAGAIAMGILQLDRQALLTHLKLYVEGWDKAAKHSIEEHGDEVVARLCRSAAFEARALIQEIKALE